MVNRQIAWGLDAPIAYEGISYEVKIYSKILDESFVLMPNGTAVFETGATYTKEEWKLLKNRKPEEIKKIHLVKTEVKTSKVEKIIKRMR